MFTGDNSGNWLYRALYKAGFANQPTSAGRDDGLALSDCYVTATLRCAPPLNKPTLREIHTCRPFLLRELELLPNIRVVVGLGKIGFTAAIDAFRATGRADFPARPSFSHCAVHRSGPLTFIASFHPSQQNTFTGRLTEPMFDRVFRTARRVLDAP
jgi:uracil-DNA glycosylase family 4